MQTVVAGEVIASVQSVEKEIASMRLKVGAEALDEADRQYLARCFDLLEMELDALRQYIAGLR